MFKGYFLLKSNVKRSVIRLVGLHQAMIKSLIAKGKTCERFYLENSGNS